MKKQEGKKNDGMAMFALIPWSDDFSDDRIFDVNSTVNRDYLLEPYMEMKQEFERLGHEIHTIDHYNCLGDVDYFLFFRLDWDVCKAIVKSGKADKMVYCTAEPPSVHRYNSPIGYSLLKHIFPFILTWNDDWTDEKSVFKRNTPYWFVDQRVGSLAYSQKKLLTCIAGNKYSDYPGELYSERKKAICFFEEYYPKEFDLYGTGWNKEEHPCYRGRIDDKSGCYHKYRFALCYENIEGLKGYITEKLLDCLVSGIVPVYAGSTDVSEYVPEECFIRLRDFDDYYELYDYISVMDEETYNSFLESADAFLKSAKSDYFSGSRYARYILDAVSHDKTGYRSSWIWYKIFKYTFGRS